LRSVVAVVVPHHRIEIRRKQLERGRRIFGQDDVRR